jgi:hypothetical protein
MATESKAARLISANAKPRRIMARSRRKSSITCRRFPATARVGGLGKDSKVQVVRTHAVRNHAVDVGRPDHWQSSLQIWLLIHRRYEFCASLGADRTANATVQELAVHPIPKIDFSEMCGVFPSSVRRLRSFV